jgi:hypothetical protein
MSYNLDYGRGPLTQLKPEFNLGSGSTTYGVKRYAMHKNMQSTGAIDSSNDFYIRQYQAQIDALKSQKQDANLPEADAFYGAEQSYGKQYAREVGVTAHPQPKLGYQSRQEYPKQDETELEDHRPQLHPNYPQKRPDPNFHSARPEPQPRSSHQEPLNYPKQIEMKFNEPQAPPQQEQPQPPQQTQQRAAANFDEIQRLREELANKEAELASLKTESPSKPKPPPSKHDLYNRFNKELWDKQVSAESKINTLSGLNQQLEQKRQTSQLMQLAREQEVSRRLDDLRKMREDELQSRALKMSREQEYRDHLLMQSKLKQQISKAEHFYDRASLAPEEVSVPPPRFKSIPAPGHMNEYERNLNDFYGTASTSPQLLQPRLTKKAPKTICYNPITGGLKDTSIYLYGSPHPLAPYKPKENPFVPIAKNQYRVPADFSVHPAFQQPRFTKMNPKMMISNPITGEANKLIHTEEFQDSLAKFYGVDDSISRNPSRKALAEYGHMVLQANGRNPAWSE